MYRLDTEIMITLVTSIPKQRKEVLVAVQYSTVQCTRYAAVSTFLSFILLFVNSSARKEELGRYHTHT